MAPGPGSRESTTDGVPFAHALAEAAGLLGLGFTIAPQVLQGRGSLGSQLGVGALALLGCLAVGAALARWVRVRRTSLMILIGLGAANAVLIGVFSSRADLMSGSLGTFGAGLVSVGIVAGGASILGGLGALLAFLVDLRGTPSGDGMPPSESPARPSRPALVRHASLAAGALLLAATLILLAGQMMILEGLMVSFSGQMIPARDAAGVALAIGLAILAAALACAATTAVLVAVPGAGIALRAREADVLSVVLLMATAVSVVVGGAVFGDTDPRSGNTSEGAIISPTFFDAWRAVAALALMLGLAAWFLEVARAERARG